MAIAFNVVRFRVKPGREQAFIDAHRRAKLGVEGFRRASLVRTGDHRFCIIAEWDSFDAMVAARPTMIGVLDTFRADLEDLGGGLGVTDPVSGEVVLSIE